MPGQDMRQLRSSSSSHSGFLKPKDAHLEQSPAVKRVNGVSNKGAINTSAHVMQTPELIRPSPGNALRTSETHSATFNIIATIVGGGTLSLPYAFRLTGFLLGIVLLFLAAAASDFSLYVLCACSRRSGTFTYIQVARRAFGPVGGYFTTGILLVFTMFIIVAYMILVRDIWTSLASFATGNEFTSHQSNLLLAVCVVITLPACVAESLHALRHMCYVGFASALMLTVAIGYRCIQHNQENPTAIQGATMWATSWGDVLQAFPIMSLAYLCQYNMLSVHAKLINPTRERMKAVIHTSVGAGTFIYLMIGLLGYFYAYGETKDDILLNFAESDPVLVLGRLGLGITMLVGVPMMVLPCRDAFDELCLDLWGGCKAIRTRRSSYQTVGDNEADRYADLSLEAGPQEDISVELPAPSEEEHHSPPSFPARALTTLGLLAVCLMGAVSLPGVGVVWSVCGSSLGFLVAYAMPAMFYLRIRAAKRFNARKLAAWVMLVLALAAMVFCTAQSVVQLTSSF